MGPIFLASEAIASRQLSRGQLRYNYRAIYPDVYQLATDEITLRANTVAAWLWSRRRGIITGRAAAAMHGAKWVSETAPVELIWNNNHSPQGIICRNERFSLSEVVEMDDDIAVASIERAAFDLGRFLEREPAIKRTAGDPGRVLQYLPAVAHLDALANATGLKAEHVLSLAENYKGARQIRRFREAIDLMDAGAQSPKETWLRLLVIDAGFPRPQTQIPVYEDNGYPFAYLDVGWEDMRIALEYDGDQHRTDRPQYVKDIGRIDKVRDRNWIVLRVVNEHHADDILRRLHGAWAQRQMEARAARSRRE